MAGRTIILRTDVQRVLACQIIQGAPVDAVVSIRESTRTSQQNDKMWAMLTDVSRQKPDDREHTPEQWKSIFMAACGHKPSFLPSLESDDFLCEGYKSSRLTVRQMADLIEQMYEFGARKNIVWSEPTAEQRR